MPWKKTSCCLCLQTCGLEVMVENNEIVKVRPDKANLRSQGYACRKGLKVAHYQISQLTWPGMALLPQGFGLNFEGKSVGVNVNLLTAASHRDRIAGTPYHRRVPCRLEKTTG